MKHAPRPCRWLRAATAAAILLTGHVLCAQESAGPKLRALHSAATDAPLIYRALMNSGGRIRAVSGTIHELAALAEDPSVDRIELSSPLRPAIQQQLPGLGLPADRGARTTGLGDGVIIGFVDTGIDWAHDGFLDDDGRTRIRWLLDLSQPPREEAETFSGSVWTGDEIDEARSSERTIDAADTVGHGTHAAGIAAARGIGTSLGADGIAPNADLIAVRASRYDDLSLEDADVIEGVDFILSRAGESPLVLNLSISGHAGPHDGSSLFEQALTQRFSDHPGRILVTAAGNDGDKSVHASGTLGPDRETRIPVHLDPAPREERSPDYTFVEFWYPLEKDPVLRTASPVTVWATAPDGRALEPAHLDTSVRTLSPEQGVLAISHSTAQNDMAQIVLFIQEPEEAEVAAGEYVVHIDGGTGRFDGWVTRPGRLGTQFVDYLDPGTRIGVPATAVGAIAVGAYETDMGPAAFSAPGPTRDGRPRPDLMAPGVDIASTMSREADPLINPLSIYHSGASPADSAVLPDGQHAIASGTSMAAPFVTGVCALLLEIDPDLTSEEAAGILRATAAPRPAGEAWDPVSGFGTLRVQEALRVLEPTPNTLDPALSKVAITRTAVGNDTPAMVLVMPIDEDGLPLRDEWDAAIEVTPEAGQATVQRLESQDQFTALFQLQLGSAQGTAVVQATVNGQPLATAPLVTFPPVASPPAPPAVGDCSIAASGPGPPLWRRR